MTPRPWRYNDQARELDDELLADFEASKKVAEIQEPQDPPEDDGLRRVIEGDTACQEINDIKVAAAAMAPELITEHSARQLIRDKMAQRTAALDAFISPKK